MAAILALHVLLREAAGFWCWPVRLSHQPLGAEQLRLNPHADLTSSVPPLMLSREVAKSLCHRRWQ